MFSQVELQSLRITSDVQQIVNQIGARAADRGFVQSSFSDDVLLTFWTLLRWERKVGIVALERLRVSLAVLEQDVNSKLNARREETSKLVQRQLRDQYFEQVGPSDQLDRDKLRLAVGPLFQQAQAILKARILDLLTQAKAESDALEHTWVGTEHVLLAICKLADDGLAAILKKHGIDHDAAVTAIIGIMSGKCR